MSHEWWNVVGVYSQGSANRDGNAHVSQGADSSAMMVPRKDVEENGWQERKKRFRSPLILRTSSYDAGDKQGRLAPLIRFMKLRNKATFQELIDDAYGGQELAEPTIRSYVSQANNYLLGINSKLSFETISRQVIRHIDQA